MSVDPDDRPNSLARSWALATVYVLRFLARLGFLGSVLIYGALAGIVALAIWGLSGRPVLDWKFVIGFSLAARCSWALSTILSAEMTVVCDPASTTHTIFIDGEAGITGLHIRERLEARGFPVLLPLREKVSGGA